MIQFNVIARTIPKVEYQLFKKLEMLSNEAINHLIFDLNILGQSRFFVKVLPDVLIFV